jgi:hypothetical protein
LAISYPSVDFMPVEIETAMNLEKWKTAVVEHFVDSGRSNLQILSQFLSRHELTWRRRVM